MREPEPFEDFVCGFYSGGEKWKFQSHDGYTTFTEFLAAHGPGLFVLIFSCLMLIFINKS